jgi:hypothetical protein
MSLVSCSFGGFASKYIKGKFFMDVHPPLAKLLITLAGFLGGFRGDFDFKEIGKDYLEPGVPYVAMRLFPALMGVLTIPTMFLTLKAYGCRTSTATMGALLLTFGMLRTLCFRCSHIADIPARKRTRHAVPVYPTRLSLGRLHRSHCPCVYELYKPA